MKDILIYHSLFSSVAEEMGEVLQLSAFSPNIKERRDFSCAIFDESGRLIAQAAHIPVHLGSMAYAVRESLRRITWKENEAVIVNDPYKGGTHLPDVTLILPVFAESKLSFFVAARAHHSDVGGKPSASMGVVERLEEEGVVISPRIGMKKGHILPWLERAFLEKVRGREEREGDLQAQWAACRLGVDRIKELIRKHGLKTLKARSRQLMRYTAQLLEKTLSGIRDGEVFAEDYLDNDGLTDDPIKLAVRIIKKEKRIDLNFSQTQDQVRGPVNTVPPVVASAIFYCLRCLSEHELPENHGLMLPVRFKIRKKSLLNPEYGKPVSLGNVETSQRLVDVIFKALHPLLPEKIPAASYGTMNNLSLSGLDEKSYSFAFYETIAGGAGARQGADGADAVHCHMTNTLNTPVEVMEQTLPVRLEEYRIRRGSGGRGLFSGGNGIVRSYTFLKACEVSFVGERRKIAPYGLAGGFSGKKGRQFLIRDSKKKQLPGKFSLSVRKGDRLVIHTPGGGGFGSPKP